jgi:hypothetical protein
MYCPSVRSMPLGPGPKRTMFVNPEKVREVKSNSRLMRTEDEADDQANSCSSQAAVLHCFVCMQRTSTHHATHLHCTLLAGLRQDTNGSIIRLSSVDGPRAPCGIDPTGTGILIIAL